MQLAKLAAQIQIAAFRNWVSNKRRIFLLLLLDT